MNRTKKIAMLIATTICSAVLSVVALFDVGLALKVKAEPAVGGEKKTVVVTDASTVFENWNNDTSTYGVNKNGVWRKDSYVGAGNRQIPIKQSLTLGDEKDAYLKFALPVYDTEGNMLADKAAVEVDLVLNNDKGQELKIRFWTRDDKHANGVNYSVAFTSQSGWIKDCGYWCSARMPGDLTADNIIGLKFSKLAGKNIAMLNADGEWYVDPNMNEADGARTDVTEFFNTATLKVNFIYWAESVTSDTNLELLLNDFDGTVYTDKSNVAIGGEKKTVEVTAPERYFENWGADTSTYGVNENGIWRKDSFAGDGNRQVPVKEYLTISDTKDAYLKFALPVYDAEGNRLADKPAVEVDLVLLNDKDQEMRIRFWTNDSNHKTGVNYSVVYTPQSQWIKDGGYWCSARMPGDLTADNIIGLKFSKRAGESIAMLNANGEWYADPNMNEADGARTDVTSFFDTATLKLNFLYWASNVTSDTNLEVLLHDFDGTVYMSEKIDENDCYIETEDTLPEVTFKGKTISVPAAKGYFGEHEVAASVIVIDSNDNEVTLTDGKFTANTGIYKIIYNAEYNGMTASLDYIIIAYSGEKTMDIPANPDDYFRGWISGPSIWDENGLTSIDNSGYDVANGHQRQSFYQADFNIENGKDVTMTVSIPIYNADGTRRSDRLNHADNRIDWIDMMLVDIDANKEFRIRMIDTYSVKGVTELFGSYYTGDPYASAENGNNGWINRYANTAIKGTFTQESSFTFRVTGVENEHFQVIAPDGTWKSVGSAADVTDDMYSLTLALNTFFKDTKNVRIGFYYWASSAVATENDNLAVTYKNINGQTFIPVDGKIADEIAPVVGAAVASSKETVLKTGTNYIYGVSFVDEIFENVEARKLVYRKKGATEWKETGIFNRDSNKITSCKFEEVGDLEIAIKAVDFAGNVGYGAISEVKVEKGYDITINGEVPEMGETGKKITLPGATASDKNGVQREVTVSVEDASGKIVKMDSENSFTPEKPGMYYIIYTSSYNDGGKIVSTYKEFKITVSEGSGTSSNSDDGCKSSISLFGLSALALLAGATFVAKKKNDR